MARGRGRLRLLLVLVGLSSLQLILLRLESALLPHFDVVAIAGAGAALVSVIAAILAGAPAGAIVAAAGGLGFYLFVSDSGRAAPLQSVVVAVALWSAAAVSAGLATDLLRRRVAERESRLRATVVEADERKQGFERIVAHAGHFHEATSVAEAAALACRSALAVLPCRLAAIVEGYPREPLVRASATTFALSSDWQESLAAALPRAHVERRQASGGAGTDVLACGVLPGVSCLWASRLEVAELRDGVLIVGFEGGGSVELRTELVERFAGYVSAAMASAATREAQAEAARLHARLETSLLPPRPARHAKLEVATYYRPGERLLQIGGDFLDVVPWGDGLAFVVGDVMGHGPDAAALGAAMRVSWRTLVPTEANPNELMAAVEALLGQERPNEDMLVTAQLGWLDGEGRRLQLLTVGHPPPLLISPKRGAEFLETRPNLPLGTDLGGREAREPVSFELPTRWTLLLYTDGLIENRLAEGARLGSEGLLEFARHELAGVSADETLDRIVARIREGGQPTGDDLALLCIGGGY